MICCTLLQQIWNASLNRPRKIVLLQSKSRTLADSLKTEKSKSRYAMEQLLIVMTIQTNELLTSFQD
jgi:hypothetical protein